MPAPRYPPFVSAADLPVSRRNRPPYSLLDVPHRVDIRLAKSFAEFPAANVRGGWRSGTGLFGAGASGDDQATDCRTHTKRRIPFPASH